LPFNWSEKDSEKLVCVRVIPNKNDRDANVDFDWSVGMELQDQCGSLTVQNRACPEDRVSITDASGVSQITITQTKLHSGRFQLVD
jgi:hypothetical protein